MSFLNHTGKLHERHHLGASDRASSSRFSSNPFRNCRSSKLQLGSTTLEFPRKQLYGSSASTMHRNPWNRPIVVAQSGIGHVARNSVRPCAYWSVDVKISPAPVAARARIAATYEVIPRNKFRNSTATPGCELRNFPAWISSSIHDRKALPPPTPAILLGVRAKIISSSYFATADDIKHSDYTCLIISQHKALSKHIVRVQTFHLENNKHTSKLI